MANTTKSIVIPEINISRLNVIIVGTTPLITHRFGESAQKSIQVTQAQEAKLARKARNPKAEFEEAIYRLPDKRPAFPAGGIKRAIVSAGQRFAEEKGTELMGAFSIPVELIPIESPKPTMRTDLVRLSGPSRTASLAYRPQFTPWQMTVPITLNENFLSLDQFLNLVRLAGFAVGIGDWRVEKKGTFGQFKIDSVISEEDGAEN